MDTRQLTLGHSPDPDDAFMFFGLAADRIETGAWRFQHVLRDIQTLNQMALRAELDITAISIHAYPLVARDYALTDCGSSMGDGYGPMVVAADPMDVDALRGRRIAIPGELTTAHLVLQLLLGPKTFQPIVVPFDRIIDTVAERSVDAGLIIHEGQLTYQKKSLRKVVDLGAWWKEHTSLPLPLGGNCIRRALGAESMREVTGILRNSIQFGLNHRSEAVAHALNYARDMGAELADEFVGMYVNRWTIEYGDEGRSAVRELLNRGHASGLLPRVGEIDLIV